jgi:hypothetical protein
VDYRLIDLKTFLGKTPGSIDPKTRIYELACVLIVHELPTE